MSLADDLKLDTLTGAAYALAEEACRIKARLDTLEGLISGSASSWFELKVTSEGLPEVAINRPLAEARGQALALRALLAELRAVQGAAVEPVTTAADPADDLAKKREDKRAAAGRA